MNPKWIFGAVFVSALAVFPALAQNVTITSLGSESGELCALDRAMLLQDPSGVNILIQPGRTVNAGDPRLEGVPVHVILLDHAHGDHMGNAANVACNGSGGTNLAPFPSTVRVAAEKNSAVLTGGELWDWLKERLIAFGEAGASTECGNNPASTEGVRDSACTAVLRPGATREITLNGEPTGVRISTVAVPHSNGIDGHFVDGATGSGNDATSGLPAGLYGYGGTETGFVIRFSNGLSVYWSGDSGFFGDMKLFSQYYGVNLAIMHIGDIFTMGPDEAAFAVNQLIKPKTVIPTHVNELATTGGVVDPGSKTERFINAISVAKVIVPLSDVPISCDGTGKCTQ